MKNELFNNSADRAKIDPRLIKLIDCVSTGKEDEIRTRIQNLPDDLLDTFSKLFDGRENDLSLMIIEKAENVRSILENECKKRDYNNRPAAKVASNGSRWVVPPEEYAIVELLTKEEGWMSSRQISEAIGGSGRSGRPRRPQWATTRGKNLVARGVLQMNEQGEFRALQNAMDVIEK